MTTNLKDSTPFSLGPVFHALPGLYMVLQPDLVIADATDAYLSVASKTREQLIGQHLQQAFPVSPAVSKLDSVHILHESLQHVLEFKEPHKMPVIRYDIETDSDGRNPHFEERYWASSHLPVFDNDGTLIYILHETQDITQQVRQHQTSVHNREHLDMLSSAIHAANWELDIQQDQIFWGANLYEVFGYTPEELGVAADSWNVRVHPDDFEKALADMEEAKNTGAKTVTLEYRFAKANGEYAHVTDKCYIIYNESGEPIRMVGSMIDISASKRVEQALLESEDRFHKLLESLPHMAWTALPNGKVIFFNRSWYAYTGMPMGQTEGWVKVIHPEDTAQVIMVWHNALTLGYYEIECRVKSSIDGQYRWFLERAEPLFDDKGNIKLWIGTYTDIDEQKQAFEQVQIRDRRLENILKLSPAHLCLLQGPNHVCKFITPGVYAMYGNRRYLGKPAREIWPELDEFDFQLLLNHVYQQGKTFTIDAFKVNIDRHQNGQKTEAWFNFKYQPILDENENIEGVLISAVEVTDLILAKNRIAELEIALQKQV
ncbi:PAS domain-containing protein [Pontibacter qinzhouensis]|uniref:histidine kinase n=1 Tax=Pontibacter qinzhouensis TaxID=2603253 RepID=A0A5C8KBE8_9BACT|nr:PAS domain-containing protein [Pontibacter qinzhouensis]TXK47453.1 PAS domain-containing protein [Pontibacter qinzhouensis]